MNPTIASLSDKIQALESELEAELAKRRADLHFGLEKGRAHFEAECCAATARCGRGCRPISPMPVRWWC